MAGRPTPTWRPPTWRRAALASTLPGLVASSACTTEDDESFRVTEVEFDNASTITLTFSEPVLSVDAVDPNDFRLSFGRTLRTTNQGMTNGYTYYSAPPGLYGYDPGFETITAGANDHQLVLEAYVPIGPAACDGLDQYATQLQDYLQEYGGQFDIALFVHYAGGEIPITSADGHEFGDVGPNWVLSGGENYGRERYGFTMNPQIRIPCP